MAMAVSSHQYSTEDAVQIAQASDAATTTTKVVKFVTTSRLEDLPAAEALVQAKLAILDTIGVTIAGPGEEGGADLIDRGLCIHALLAASLLGIFPAQAFGQTKEPYPSHPVRFIIPFPPGGGTEIAGRLMGQRFAEELGQPFVIDNRPGAAGTIGAAIVAKAAPDGYTLLFASASHAISASFYKNLPYDSSADFSGAGRVVSGPLVLVAHPSVAANSVKDVIALAKQKPGVMNYASSGAGSITHLATEMFLSMTGTRITHVSYKGAAPARIALLGGQVQLLIAPLGPTVEFIRTGKLKALGLCGARRSALLPSLPTIAESGVPGYEADTWYGVLAPRGTPASILDLLNIKILEALKHDQFAMQLSALGFEPAGTTPKQFDAYIKSEIAKWGRAMKDAGIQQN